MISAIVKQVKDEAVNAFGQDERHLSRAAVEKMDYTVSALKVCCASRFQELAPIGCRAACGALCSSRVIRPLRGPAPP
jgi:hypothetical protein